VLLLLLLLLLRVVHSIHDCIEHFINTCSKLVLKLAR
jgi:hypothetical protein